MRRAQHPAQHRVDPAIRHRGRGARNPVYVAGLRRGVLGHRQPRACPADPPERLCTYLAARICGVHPVPSAHGDVLAAATGHRRAMGAGVRTRLLAFVFQRFRTHRACGRRALACAQAGRAGAVTPRKRRSGSRCPPRCRRDTSGAARPPIAASWPANTGHHACCRNARIDPSQFSGTCRRRRLTPGRPFADSAGWPIASGCASDHGRRAAA